MTVRDALKEELSLPVSEGLITKKLISHGFVVEDDEAYDIDKDVYNPLVHDEKIDLCIIEILVAFITSGDIQEGQYAIRYDKEAIRSRIDLLCAKRGVPNQMRPIIQGVSRW